MEEDEDMKYRYRVYDELEKEWLPGDYDCKGLRNTLGVDSNFNKYAVEKYLLRGRYRIEIVSRMEDSCEGKQFPPSLMAEWERVRKMILRGYK